MHVQVDAECSCSNYENCESQQRKEQSAEVAADDYAALFGISYVSSFCLQIYDEIVLEVFCVGC